MLTERQKELFKQFQEMYYQLFYFLKEREPTCIMYPHFIKKQIKENVVKYNLPQNIFQFLFCINK